MVTCPVHILPTHRTAGVHEESLISTDWYIFIESDVSLLKEFDEHLSDCLVLPWSYVHRNSRTVSRQNRRYIICGWVSLPLVSCESAQDLAVGKLNCFNFSGNGRCPWVYIMIFVHSLRFVSEPGVPRSRCTMQGNLQQNRWSLRKCVLTKYVQTIVAVDLILFYIVISGCSMYEMFYVISVYVTFYKILKVLNDF